MDKNDRDNANYSDGYNSGRNDGPLDYVANSLLRGFYGDQWNKGYDQGVSDRAEHGSQD